jgi:hypothetical protein
MEHVNNAESVQPEGGKSQFAQRGLLILSHDMADVTVYWEGPNDPPFDVITVDWDVERHDLDEITGGVEVQDESGITLRASVWDEKTHDLKSDNALLQAVRAHRTNNELQS